MLTEGSTFELSKGSDPEHLGRADGTVGRATEAVEASRDRGWSPGVKARKRLVKPDRVLERGTATEGRSEAATTIGWPSAAGHGVRSVLASLGGGSGVGRSVAWRSGLVGAVGVGGDSNTVLLATGPSSPSCDAGWNANRPPKPPTDS